VNDQQAGALKRILEGRHPDLAVAVTPTEGGVEVIMTGPAATSASSAVGDVTLILGDDSPYLWRLLVGNA
jgi:hypothetical protein